MRKLGLAAGIAAAVLYAAPAHAEQIVWNPDCPGTDIGLDTLSSPATDTTKYEPTKYDVEPNVPFDQALDVKNTFNYLDYNQPNGTFTGALACTLNANGFTAPYSRPVTLAVSTVDATRQQHLFTLAPSTASVPLGGGSRFEITMDQVVDGSSQVTKSSVPGFRGVLIVPNQYVTAVLRKPPVPTTTAATAIDTHQATLNGTVNPLNLEAKVHFEYGPPDGAMTSTPEQTIPAGNAPVTVSAPVTGLSHTTRYRYRLVASNSVGTADPAPTVDFDTLIPPAAPPAPTPTPSPTPTATPAPKPVLKPDQVVTLPANKRCLSKRNFAIHIRLPNGVSAKSATVSVNGKARPQLTGKQLTKAIDLRGLPKGNVTVKVKVLTTDGRTVSQTRRYKTCAKNPKKK